MAAGAAVAEWQGMASEYSQMTEDPPWDGMGSLAALSGADDAFDLNKVLAPPTRALTLAEASFKELLRRLGEEYTKETKTLTRTVETLKDEARILRERLRESGDEGNWISEQRRTSHRSSRNSIMTLPPDIALAGPRVSETQIAVPGQLVSEGQCADSEGRRSVRPSLRSTGSEENDTGFIAVGRVGSMWSDDEMVYTGDLGMPSREIWQRPVENLDGASGSTSMAVNSKGDRLSAAVNSAKHLKTLRKTYSLRGSAQRPSGRISGSDFVARLSSTGDITTQTHKTCLERLVIHPSSKKRLVWELVGGLLIGIDLVVIPLSVFDPPPNWFTWSLDMFALLFWTANMIVSCFAGYFSQGEPVLDPKSVLRNYLTAWFWIDCVVVAPDWVFFFLTKGNTDTSAAGGNAKMLRLLRMVRLARTIRLLRLLKLSWILDKINDYMESEATSILANVLQMIMLLLTVNHFVGCIWFWIGSNTGEKNWVRAFEFNEEKWTAQYGVSFHWSITQFTPAGMPVQPQNEIERVFAVTIVIFALVGFSYIVGSITGSLTQLRAIKEEAAKEFWKLRRYLKRNQVANELSQRIQVYIEYEHQRKLEGTAPNSTKLLALLSEQLQGELECALAVPHLKIHPLFDFLAEATGQTLRRLARLAISSKHCAKNDTLFYSKEQAAACYFVKNGKLVYSRAWNQEVLCVEKKEQNWVSEQVLWTSAWVHVGELRATGHHNTMLAVEPTKFGEVICRNPTSFELMQRYATFFMQRLNATPRADLSDISKGDANVISEALGVKPESQSEEGRTGTGIARVASTSGLPGLPNIMS